MKSFLNQTTNISLILFLFLATYNLVIYVKEDVSSLNKLKIVQSQLNRIAHNSKTVLELQRERGLTNIYFANPSKEHQEKVVQQREKTAEVLVNIQDDSLKQTLKDIHTKVDTSTGERVFIFNHYSSLIRNLFLDTQSLTYQSDNKVLKNELNIYNDLNSLQEKLGQLRAKVGFVLSLNKLDTQHSIDITRNNTLFQNQLEITFINDILSSRKYTRKISKSKCLKKAFLISKTLQKELEKEDTISAIEWFKLSTCAVDAINNSVNKQLAVVNKQVEIDISNLYEKRVQYAVLWLFGFVILAIFVYVAYRGSKELRKEQVLLKNYKKAIDYSSMVFTSDKNDLITHANSNLISLTHYKKEELLGENISTIIDDNNSQEILDEIDKCKKNNQVYNGIIKQKTKDGTTIWADTYIIPILDHKKRVVEYITIGCDISEILNLNEEIRETQRELLYRLGDAVESRNKNSGYHIKRVALFSKLLAELYHLSEEESEIIFSASSMHDIGKVAIPDNILLKPAKLTPDEWKVMQTHSEIGYQLFKDSKRPILKSAAAIAHEHHEYYNGKGYPRGLKGEEISIFSRIVAIADVFDALSSQRPYKEPWKFDDIKSLFQEELGEQFDPKLTQIFLDNFDKFVEIRNNYK